MCARSEEAGAAPVTDTNSSSRAAGLGLGADHRAEQVDHGSAPASPPTVTSRLAASASGPGRRPALPGVDQRRCAPGGPREVERGGRGLGQRAEREARDHAEAQGARAAERPEQVLVAVLVALQHPAVGEHHLGRDHLVRREPPAAAKQAKPAAEGLAADPDRGAAAAGIVRSCWARAA
jgi:hypothetical protein